MPMHFRNTAIAMLAAVQCLVASQALAGAPDAQGSAETTWPTKSWTVSTPDEQGVDSAGLARLIEIVGTTNAIKGRWVNARTFAVERRILGHSETQAWTLAFDGNTVNVSF